MRSISQMILVDRLANALKSKGVHLKRSAVLEIAAKAFGHADSNVFAKAAQAGEMDPPSAVAISHDGRAFAWLKDPISGQIFAYQPDGSSESTSDAFVLSPYGNILRVPEGTVAIAERDGERSHLPTDPWTVGTDDEGRRYQQVGSGSHILSLDCGSTHHGITGLEKYHLERFSQLVDVDVDLDPFTTMRCMGVSLLDGRPSLTYVETVECDGHDMTTTIISEMESLAFETAENLNATGCVLRWTDDAKRGNIEIEFHVPESALVDLEDEDELEDAILGLLKSPVASGDFSLKALEPAKDSNAINHVGQAIHDPLPPVHTRYWTHEGRTMPLIEIDRDEGVMMPNTRDVKMARSLTCMKVEIVTEGDVMPKQLDLPRLALVDGEPHHIIEFRRACDHMDEHGRDTLARTIMHMDERVAPLIERLGGTHRLEDAGHSMAFVAYLPISLSKDVQDDESWRDAIAHLFGDRRKETVEARYDPQAWQNDHAIDVDPDGPQEIDITWEVLTMGRHDAATFKDNRDFTEGLTDAVMAPKWIRDHHGPSAIYARAAVDEFFEQRGSRIDLERRSRRG